MELRDYCITVKERGQNATITLLNDKFEPSLVSHLIESGQLMKVPNTDGFEIYEWYE